MESVRVRGLVAAVAASLCVMSVGVAAGEAQARPVSPPKALCANSDQATLGSVFDAVLDAATPILPVAYRKVLPQLRAEGHDRLSKTGISMLMVSSPASELTSDADAPLRTLKDPVTNYIVTQLMNVRDGRIAQSIPAEKLTLNQAIETSYFLIYTTTLVPMKIISGMIPSIMSVGPVSLGTLITLPMTLGSYGFTAIYTATQRSLESRCVVKADPATLEGAGTPVAGTDTGVRVSPLVTELAETLAVNDGTCKPVSDMTLGRVIARTVSYLRTHAPDAATRAAIVDQGARLEWIAKNVMVADNLIPENPDDFTTIETLLSTALGFIPKVGGAATDTLIGLGANASKGKRFDHTVPLASLPVDKSLTAARFAYSLTTQVMEIGFSVFTGKLGDLFSADYPTAALNPFDLIPSPFPLINVPNAYGLATYQHVLRSVCLVEDRLAPVKVTAKAPATPKKANRTLTRVKAI
ncbi:hypothetical protein [Gordonia jinhuaensis]|uniref:hypothetical protein n=1 Tax=Gordonia jinhuaensis TaxID=1517702 RepID=UPI0016656D21|nr:hypothetical protein [Gordonia jinhuaensis]